MRERATYSSFFEEPSPSKVEVEVANTETGTPEATVLDVGNAKESMRLAVQHAKLTTETNTKDSLRRVDPFLYLERSLT